MFLTWILVTFYIPTVLSGEPSPESQFPEAQPLILNSRLLSVSMKRLGMLFRSGSKEALPC